MAIARANSSELLSVLLIILVAALFMPNIRASYFQKGGSDQRFTTQSGIQPDFLMHIEPNQFLMRNSTTADPVIVFTTFNGFVGNVTLSAGVSPVEHSAPTVSFYPSTVHLNASLPGSSLYPMLVTTNQTESGLYTITITGSSASITHSAVATVGVTSVFVPANSAYLVYKGHFTAVAHVGGSTVLNSTFIDLGYVPIGITNLSVSLSFGTYTYPHPCTQNVCATGTYLELNPYDEKTTTFPIQIPNSTREGNYTVTATISWVLNPFSIYEQPASDLVAHGYLIVYSNSPNPPQLPRAPANTVNTLNGLLRLVIPVLAGAAAIAILVVGLVVRSDRKKRATFERLPIKTLFCAQCGTPAAFGTRFCAKCGHQIS